MSHELNYRKALRYLYGLTDYEKRGFAAYAPEHYNLARMNRLLALLGDPLRSFRAVHVAGTKGKGSTAAMIDAMLRVAGYRTGLYTSPHLHTFRERIQVQGDMIPEADVLRLINKIRPLADRIPAITTFEVMTGLAFAWFAEQGVAWAVLEVGLGGRLDATNVVTPAVSVITSISLDHVVILGDTLAQIAAEKAGIVKPGVPVVSAPQHDEALAVIRDTCRRLEAPLTLVGHDWTWQPGAASLEGQCFSLRGEGHRLDDLWLPLLGEYQLVNAATAVAAVQRLREAGAEIPETAVSRGLQAVCWPGRLEILARSPLIVADSAHNGDSARKLRAALEAHLDFQELIVILGASADHITPDLLRALLSDAGRAIATQARHPRASSPDWLQSQAAEAGFQMERSDTVPQALDRALAGAHPDALILCTGSVFVAAEARAAWFVRQGRPLPPVDPF
jgi:dihydrofolate synthase/folylpolyglutamate synthase